MSLLGIYLFFLFLEMLLGVLFQQRATDPHVLMEYSAQSSLLLILLCAGHRPAICIKSKLSEIFLHYNRMRVCGDCTLPSRALENIF